MTNANDPASWILFDKERVGSTEAILISDTIANGYGRKLVIGVGEVDFDDQNLNLRFNIREDWDNDGNINRYRYEGTDFDDLIIYLDENKDGLSKMKCVVARAMIPLSAVKVEIVCTVGRVMT